MTLRVVEMSWAVVQGEVHRTSHNATVNQDYRMYIAHNSILLAADAASLAAAVVVGVGVDAFSPLPASEAPARVKVHRRQVERQHAQEKEAAINRMGLARQHWQAWSEVHRDEERM